MGIEGNFANSPYNSFVVNNESLRLYSVWERSIRKDVIGLIQHLLCSTYHFVGLFTW